jgi:hypothetical protein
LRVAKRTISKSWDDSIFSESAQAGFWSVLSLPPLLLGMLGSLAFIAPLFGPDTLSTIQSQLISTSNSFFSKNIVTEIIEPTVRDIAQGSRGEVVSLGFVISLWAGSSAISAFVDSVVEAHDQTPLRHPVRQEEDVAVRWTLTESDAVERPATADLWHACVEAATLTRPAPAHVRPPVRLRDLVIAIDPAAYAPGFATRLAALAEAIEAQEGARLPGARRRAARERTSVEGVELDADLARRLGLR